MSHKKGRIVAVNGNMITVEFDTSVIQNEVAYAVLGDSKLKAEVIRIRGNRADLQVFEDTRGLTIGDITEFSGELLSIELAPGLLTKVFDGLQNPLPELAEECGFFLQRGKYLPALDSEKKWDFTPVAKAGDDVFAGSVLGSVPEGIFEHKIMTPFDISGQWKVKSVVGKGEYNIKEIIAVITSPKGEERDVKMLRKWPVKIALNAYEERLRPLEPMATQ